MSASPGADRPTTLYDAVGGRAGVLALAAAWHARCLDDPVASHPFSHGGLHPDHVERLAAYWGEAWGGPPDFTSALGDHAAVVRMHAGQGEHADLDQRTIDLFALAMVDAGVPEDARAVLEDYFRHVTTELAQYPDSADGVPADAPFPHWGWDGPTG